MEKKHIKTLNNVKTLDKVNGGVLNVKARDINAEDVFIHDKSKKIKTYVEENINVKLNVRI